MEKSKLRRADLITSIILIIFSVYVAIGSIKLMMNTLNGGKDWFKSAGLFPLIISLLLALCAVLLLINAIKDGAKIDFFTIEKIKALFVSREFKVALIVIGFLALYIFVLIPLLPYEVATFIYLLVFMVIFNEKKPKNIIISVVVSLVATFMLYYGFGKIALIPLP